MSIDEVVPVLDVHPPHEAVHGWRDFLLHLLTITIGLLIALSLEGMVEWEHHRHLVHEAEASLHAEIKSNSDGLQKMLTEVEKQQSLLKQDVVTLKGFMAKPKPKHGTMEIGFHISNFDSVSWKTAQSTGALAYMPYGKAQEFAEIYSTQDELQAAEQVAARDAIISLAPFMNSEEKDPDPDAAEANAIKDKIEVLQGQLLLVDSLVKGLDQEYKKFLAAHSE
ncbi:hypothetical protein [Granulicella tundricola]|uniref:Uncharacterized protein n=1 Tax=Granulicella tundricola (strain ATCC BAA-1859 / DSM 23138 / MP5ACTX9) TaxID=1198114 RepID=E8WWV7_GRATM|nr:hypothetical protein [Granulicella tundricola]ADW67435.1 hypothetical protein AciX9_0363 [Granulicella tundricola MP5ACTX9]